MPEVAFKGVKINYHVTGEGPAVVLIHGFLESTWMWKDIAPVLAKKHKVICVDLPGHGASESIGYVHTMEEMAEAVMAVCKELKLRKVAVVGHSMGGYVALALAEAFPDLIKVLVLYHSTALADSPAKKNDRLRAIELIRKSPSSFIRNSIPLLFRPVNRKLFKAQIDALKLEALKTTAQGVVAAIQGMRQRPSREVLLTFPPYPVHLIASDKDPRIPLEESLAQAKLSSGVRLQVIHGCGHMSYIENLPRAIECLELALR
jgi:pimeloyl-ACP methyl ester carboxylesterase